VNLCNNNLVNMCSSTAMPVSHNNTLYNLNQVFLPNSYRHSTKMCISLLEAHLCGWHGVETRRVLCPAAIAISQLVVLAESDVFLMKRLDQECDEVFEERLQVRSDPTCFSCRRWQSTLGPFQAQLRCNNIARSWRRRY
jgi:hypothetical protein